MKYIFSAYFLFILFVSCENNSDNKGQVSAPTAAPSANSLFPLSNDSAAKVNTGSGVALNPKHGEPGHRCDLDVGAPLPQATTNSSIQPTITPTAVTPAVIPGNDGNKPAAPASTTGTVALNPKHGESGHRCDIAVGAPLNSKPTQ